MATNTRNTYKAAYRLWRMWAVVYPRDSAKADALMITLNALPVSFYNAALRSFCQRS